MSDPRTPPDLRMPAEWEPHEATWIAWPHHEPDWPGKLDAIHWVYAEIARVLAMAERVEILCHDRDVAGRAAACLRAHHVETSRYRLHLVPNDRSWVRDSGPTGVLTASGQPAWIQWRFNAWAKYENHQRDQHVPPAVAELTGLDRIDARRPDRDAPLVLEGGAIDTDGAGTLLTTEECLLSEVQERNPGLTREGYEQAFARYLGIRKTIWLDRGVEGDDTHGHVDDLARFVGPATVALAVEEDPDQPNHEASRENLARLENASDAAGRAVRVVKIPMPRRVMFDGEVLPASYLNFYIANGVVLVPTFNDPNDRVALSTLSEWFPRHRVIGIHAVDLVWGFGTLHCLTQPQPRAQG